MAARHGCRWNCRSLRDLFFLILVVATVSTMLTLHISKCLPWLSHDCRIPILVEERLEKSYHDGLGLPQNAPATHDKGHDNVQSHRQQQESLHILPRLLQIEEEILTNYKQRTRITALGTEKDVNQELLYYEPAFRKHLENVKIITKDGNKDGNTDAAGSNGTSSDIVLCLSGTDTPKTCILEDVNAKANRITPLFQTFSSQEGLCRMLKTLHDVPGVWREFISSICFLLPGDWDDFISVADVSKNITWIFSPIPGSIYQVWRFKTKQDFEYVNRYRGQRGLILQMVGDPLLLLDGGPATLRLHVLVTSFSPLRVYLHDDAIVQKGIGISKQTSPHKIWTLSQLGHRLPDQPHSDTASVMLKNLHSSIITLLLAAESMLAEFRHQFENIPVSRCVRCFQLLQFDVVFNSTFHPTILQVTGLPNTQDLNSVNEYAVKQKVLEDMAAIVTAHTSVAMDVARGLHELTSTISLSDVPCPPGHKLCLCERDFIFLLESRREGINIQNFLKLYPSKEASMYTSLLQDLQRFTVKNQFRILESISDNIVIDESLPFKTGVHSTADMHSLLVSLERFYSNLEVEDLPEQYDDLNIPIDPEKKLSARSSNDILTESKPQNNTGTNKKYIRPSCSEDAADMPYLMALNIEPYITLTPNFSRSVTEYSGLVEYGVFLIKVWAFALACGCKARMEDKYGKSGPVNFTLGIGENYIFVRVVDNTHSDPWVISTYTITINRKGPSEDLEPFSAANLHEVCSLKQDCSLPFAPNEQCGLQKTEYSSWPNLKRHLASLASCQRGDQEATWLVPCSSCGPDASCYWHEAVWQPGTCRYDWIKDDDVKKCFTGKKVLFLGDSTNRGILHYIMERLNGSLTEWDKTHNTKLYVNLNGGHTAFTFAYYPQFWLPANHRPVFDKALYQLVKKNMPLSNDSSTVLVVGGVHWLAKHHINVVLRALRREGLTGIKLIMKGLGAGFHQPVDGLHCLSKKEHQKVHLHNHDVSHYAIQNGFHVVETFNMTMARYKDFLQGKCACHFHRVSKVKNKDRTDDGSHTSETQTSYARYHVDGDINAIYSEMVINQICN